MQGSSNKLLVGMIHLPPLPGAANYDGQPVRDIRDAAVAEAGILAEAGFAHIMVQNTHDRPSVRSVAPATAAAMAAVASGIADSYGGALGINVHKNDAAVALSVAHACGASFVRIKVLVAAVVGPEGLIEGVAAEALHLRAQLDERIEIWADLYELTSWPVAPTSLANLADLNARFGGADRLIVTNGSAQESLEAVAEVRKATDVPVLIGGRTNADNIRQSLEGSDGVIVGTNLRQGGKTSEPLDPDALKRFMDAARH